MLFEKLTLDDKELYERYTQKKYMNSEASFSNMFIWRKPLDLHFAIINEMLVLRFTFNNEYRFVMPFGDDSNIEGCIEILCNYCKNIGCKLEIRGANMNFINIASEKYDFTYEEMRNQRDYIYLTKELATLSGKKLHSKKNHVNKFKSTYNYNYKALDSIQLDLCLEKTKEWFEKKYEGNTDKYKTELDTIEDAFKYFNELDFFGGAIYVDNNLVAYTVAQELTKDTVLVHIEKADIEYQGSFAIINYEFQNQIFNKYKYANREEDMGIEGLRKAKLSYQPVFLTDKFCCKFD